MWANGNVYEGQWVDNKKQGNGTYKRTNGDFYEGQWF